LYDAEHLTGMSLKVEYTFDVLYYIYPQERTFSFVGFKSGNYFQNVQLQRITRVFKLFSTL